MSTATTTATYVVRGMTCQHCASAVTDELTAVPGVSAVQVDLAGGTATVTSATPLDVDALRAAVEEAGYELAPPEG